MPISHWDFIKPEKKRLKNLVVGQDFVEVVCCLSVCVLYCYVFARFHNKGVYVRLSLSKMISKGNTSDLVRRVIMEVSIIDLVMYIEVGGMLGCLQCDGKVVRLPDVEGIIVLNIGSWGSGADLWGSDRDDVSQRQEISFLLYLFVCLFTKLCDIALIWCCVCRGF